MNYLQEHNDGLRWCLLSLAHSDTTTENDEFVTILAMETFREHNVNFCGNEQRHKSKLSLSVAVNADGGCAPAVHQSSQRWHLRFAFVFVWTNTPIFFSHRYDHTNNPRLGVIYLAQINQLPMEVLQQFQQGNWVLKGSDGRFNQVDTDDSTSG